MRIEGAREELQPELDAAQTWLLHYSIKHEIIDMVDTNIRYWLNGLLFFHWGHKAWRLPTVLICQTKYHQIPSFILQKYSINNKVFVKKKKSSKEWKIAAT